MKIRLADFVANFIVDKNITTGFSVVGGGAMYLNDAFGHNDKIEIIYNHHEQACAISAESYARLNNKPALVCLTTGPGGINALNGVAAAYLDSLPMIVISGQVRHDMTSRYEKKLNGANLRSFGDQEFDIVETVKNMTKYAVSIENENDIKFELERAYNLATTGRMGPVWIDIPVDFQNAIIDTKKLKSYKGSKEYKNDIKNLPPKITLTQIDEIIKLIKKSKRPVIYAGYGIRLSGVYEEFRKLVKKLNIPVITYWNSIDLIESQDNLYCGRAGNMGDRAGNFAIQNADLILAIGTRLSIRQVGYNYKTWARKAKVIMVDIDKEEFKKHTIHISKKVWCDAKDFINTFLKRLQKEKTVLVNNIMWNNKCLQWKEKYPVVDDAKKITKKVNVYNFIDILSKNLNENSLTVVSNGACCVAGHQAFVIKKGTRFHNNNAIASMGYGLPASIGACISNNKKETICLEGDGSIMMNLQELQTIKTNNLPIKIFIINNEGYHSIRITQNNIFNGRKKIGIGNESNDLSFPEYKKIAKAFSYKYLSINKNDKLDKIIKKALNYKKSIIVEVFTDINQVWEPKNSAKKLKDGKIVSPPLEDLEPFLSKEEIKENMFIDMVEY